MTSRIGKPDTSTDKALYQRLDGNGVRHFVMIAGAGSGKTTSLVKALSHLDKSQGAKLRQRKQQIACITYTEVAVNEIWGDVENAPLFHVSTIHSFLWSVIKPFQSDLHIWVRNRLDEKIAEAQEKIAKPRTQTATKERLKEDIERYKRQKEHLSLVKSFKYGTGSDYSNGTLGHSDILKIGPTFMTEHELMRNVIARRFPVIFVDESQDTDPSFVDALLQLARTVSEEFCLGFFGDPVQKIYLQGKGAILAEENWETIRKPENFRCPQKVLKVINKIRAEDDKLSQIRGRMIEHDGKLIPVEGTARLFILPADERRQERLEFVQKWLAKQNDDPLWLPDAEKNDVRLLVLVHRMAATRLGFSDLYASLNDKAPDDLKSGLVDGTAWVLRPFLTYFLPLVTAQNRKEHFEVMRLLRNNCPRLQPDYLRENDAADELARLKEEITAFTKLLNDQEDIKIGDVVKFSHEKKIIDFDRRFEELVKVFIANEPLGENNPENAGHRFMRCYARELWGYQKYIEDRSPFVTQQGIKGAEFQRVLVIIDDEEGEGQKNFSYGKYFGVTPLSDTDNKNISEGNDSVVDRTRRLFYVCCSRAVNDLAVVIFAHDTESMYKAIIEKDFFETVDIHLL